jgi:septal ring factor EnvC (AmiA/AmiB activator)
VFGVVSRAQLILLLTLGTACFSLMTQPVYVGAQAQKQGSENREHEADDQDSREQEQDFVRGSQGATGQEEINRRRRELDALRKQVEEKRKRAEELEGQERSVKAQIADVEENLRLTEKFVAKLDEREKEVKQELTDAEKRLSNAQVSLDYRKGLLARRLRAMYKYGRYRSLAALVSASSFADVMNRYRFMHLVAKRDREIIQSVKSYRREVELTHAELETSQAEIEKIQKEKSSEKTNLAALKSKRQKAMASIKEEKDAHLAAISELEESARKIQALIEKLEAARAAAPAELPDWATDLTSAAGHLRWPVDGEVVTNFGANVNPRFGTSTYSNGVDISATLGTPVRCVADGKVEFVDWLPGYDSCIIVNHGGGYYTLYAHLADVVVAPDQEVKGGETIARVGEGSSVKGHVLHFEIRHGKEAVNPLEWLLRK